MRIRTGTYIRTAAVLLVAVAALAGCGSSPKDERVAGSTLTIYESLPLHGPSARMADAVAAGSALALADAHGVAGGHRVRLVQLDSSDPTGADAWDPSAVEANAKRAANDPTTIAYIGELDQGGSAISVPVTNDKDILQVSPLDGLTSLTEVDPSVPSKTGPERYYPNGRRTFLRLVPTDLLQAAALVEWASQDGAQTVALVQDEHIFGRELAAQTALAATRLHLQVADVEEARGGPNGYPDLAQKIATHHPDAVIYTGAGDQPSGVLMASLETAMPRADLFGSSALATGEPAPPGLPPASVLDPTLPVSAYPLSGRHLLKRLKAERGAPIGAQALYGYDAMQLILAAIDAAGSHSNDRIAVVEQALKPRLRRSVLGDYRVLASGDVSIARFGAYRRLGDELQYQGTREAGAAEVPTQATVR